MRRFRAYGLTLACERDLPFAAAPADGAADVTVVDALGQAAGPPCGEIRRELVREGARWSLRFTNPEGGWLHFNHDAGAKRLTVAGSVDWNVAVPVLSGVACAVLLASAGRPLLHGAAVASDGVAIGILGESGQGKSTLAAALLGAGGRLLSEDLLAFSIRGPDFEVEPGYARISLLPDSCEALGLGASPAEARAGTPKSWIDTAPSAEPVAVGRVYILAPPDPAAPAGAARRLSRSAAAPALVRQLYGADWIRPISREDLAFCASMAASVPVFALSRAATLDRVDACAAMLLADV